MNIQVSIVFAWTDFYVLDKHKKFLGSDIQGGGVCYASLPFFCGTRFPDRFRFRAILCAPQPVIVFHMIAISKYANIENGFGYAKNAHDVQHSKLTIDLVGSDRLRNRWRRALPYGKAVARKNFPSKAGSWFLFLKSNESKKRISFTL